MSSTIILATFIAIFQSKYLHYLYYVHHAKKADFAPSHKKNLDRLLKNFLLGRFFEKKTVPERILFFMNQIFNFFNFKVFSIDVELGKEVAE
jgi:hypothetical protein